MKNNSNFNHVVVGQKPSSFSTPQESHQVLGSVSGHARIWRYMDFAKYVSLLDSKALYFSRADLLGDPYEASVPEGMLKRLEKEIAQCLTEDTPQAKKKGEDLQKFIESLKMLSYVASKTMFVNCWHVNKVESDAMWRIYLQSGEGIAIETSVARLSASLQPFNRNLLIGKLNYKDYLQGELANHNNIVFMSEYVFTKRVSFAHEKELRAVTWDWDAPTRVDESPDGIPIPVDLKTLIRKVYVSPRAKGYLRHLVESVSQKYDVRVPIHDSAMARPPVAPITTF